MAATSARVPAENLLDSCSYMAWLAKLDARAARCSRLIHWPYLALKWYIVFLGAFVWLGLWWQRHWSLGIAQGVIFGLIAYPSLADRWPILRRQRRGDPRERDPNLPGMVARNRVRQPVPQARIYQFPAWRRKQRLRRFRQFPD